MSFNSKTSKSGEPEGLKRPRKKFLVGDFDENAIIEEEEARQKQKKLRVIRKAEVVLLVQDKQTRDSVLSRQITNLAFVSRLVATLV